MPYKHTWCQTVTSLYALLEAILCIYYQLKATVLLQLENFENQVWLSVLILFPSHSMLISFFVLKAFFHSTRSMIYFSF